MSEIYLSSLSNTADNCIIEIPVSNWGGKPYLKRIISNSSGSSAENIQIPKVEHKYKSRYAPGSVVKMIMDYSEGLLNNVKDLFVAGGALRSYYAREPIRDLDVFTCDQSLLFHRDGEAGLYLSNHNWEFVVETPNAITYKKGPKVLQLIKCRSGNPIDVISKFDFTICCCACDAQGMLYYKEGYFEDLAGRLLIPLTLERPLSALKRALSFAKRGYHLSDTHLLTILKQIRDKVTLDNPLEVKKQLTLISAPDKDDGGKGVEID